MNDEDRFPAALVLAGAGKMGGAMLQGWLDLGFDPARANVIDPQPSLHILELASGKGVALAAPATPPEVLVLAIKPQVLDDAAAGLASLVAADTLVISILAGKTIANIKDRFPEAQAIIRAMPNLPAAVGRGITGLAANENVSARQRTIAEALLGAIGRVEWLPHEGLIDAVTALSGSGPAYVFYL